MEYPVCFRCVECTLEHDGLEPLISHIWNRHLGKFPFNCAVCNYPALTPKALNLHYCESHPLRPAEFKRKIVDEIRVYEIVVQSIVVPLYLDGEEPPDEEGDVMYEEQQIEGEGHLGMEGSIASDVQEEIGVDTISRHDQETETWVEAPNLTKDAHNDLSGVSQLVYMDEVAEVEEDSQTGMGNIRAEDEDGTEMAVVSEEIVQQMDDSLDGEHEHEVGQEVELMEDILEDQTAVEEVLNGEHDGETDDGAYEIFEAEDGEEHAFEEGTGDEEEVEYIDEEGNTVLIASAVIPKTSGGMREKVRLRLLRNEHIEYIVSKVAASDGHIIKRRETTVHECEYCGKILKYPSRIKEHMRMHSGGRPFKCHTCNSSFSQKSALTVHMRLHTGEKPFACTWDCGKTFISSSALRGHEKMHSGHKPYRCDICGHLFAKKSHLIRHETTKHAAFYTDQPIEDEDTTVTEECKLAVEEVIAEVREEKRVKKYARRGLGGIRRKREQLLEEKQEIIEEEEYEEEYAPASDK